MNAKEKQEHADESVTLCAPEGEAGVPFVDSDGVKHAFEKGICKVRRGAIPENLYGLGYHVKADTKQQQSAVAETKK